MTSSLVLFGERDDALEEIEVHHLGRRVVGKGEDHHLRPRPHRLDRPLGAVDEVPLPAREGDRADVRPGDDHGVGVDRVRRAGDERDVPRAHRGQHEVGQPLLRSDRGDRLRFRVEVHVVFPLVPVADGQTQLRDPAGKRIAVVPRVADRLDKLVDDVLRRGKIGVSHPQVDDVLAGVAQFRLELHHDREYVRRQPLDSRELFH